MNEVVYTPDSPVGRPAELLREMVADALRSRELAWRMMVRNIRVQYRRSLLGGAWVFIPAAATAAILSMANRAQIITVGETHLPYAAYVVLSMTLWQTFLDALNGPIQGLAAEKGLLSKFNVAPEGIALAKLGEAVFNFGVRSVLVAALFVWYGVPVRWTMLLAAVGVAGLVLLGAAIGLALAPLGLLYDDVAKSLPIVTSCWFFLTPIIYTANVPGIFGAVIAFNPVTPLLVTTRDLATGHPVSALTAFAATMLLAGTGAFFGWFVYRVSLPIVLERAKS